MFASLVTMSQDGKVFLFHPVLSGCAIPQSRKKVIDDGHRVLESAHPSGLSASRGFFGCRHFSKCNSHLRKRGVPEVDWQIPQ
jgi:uracil-DNA glycosylase